MPALTYMDTRHKILNKTTDWNAEKYEYVYAIKTECRNLWLKEMNIDMNIENKGYIHIALE